MRLEIELRTAPAEHLAESYLCENPLEGMIQVETLRDPNDELCSCERPGHFIRVNGLCRTCDYEVRSKEMWRVAAGRKRRGREQAIREADRKRGRR